MMMSVTKSMVLSAAPTKTLFVRDESKQGEIGASISSPPTSSPPISSPPSHPAIFVPPL